PEVHALAHRLNHRLGNVGKTVRLTADHAEPPARDELTRLVSVLNEGKCQTLLVLGGNPSFAAPADIAFSEAVAKVPQRFHLALAPNETTAACNWYLPLSHPLECWGDVRLDDGSYGLG